jgi:hypothetical protein
LRPHVHVGEHWGRPGLEHTGSGCDKAAWRDDNLVARTDAQGADTCFERESAVSYCDRMSAMQFFAESALECAHQPAGPLIDLAGN